LILITSPIRRRDGPESSRPHRRMGARLAPERHRLGADSA